MADCTTGFEYILKRDDDPKQVARNLLKQIEELERTGFIKISDDEPNKKGRSRKIYHLGQYCMVQFELDSGGFNPRIIIKSSEEISDGL